MLQIVLRQNLISFSPPCAAGQAAPACCQGSSPGAHLRCATCPPRGLLCSPSPACGKPALGEVSALLKWDAGDSCRHFSVTVHAAEEQAVIFLLLNIWFLKLTVSSKEPELKSAGSQELMRGQPQSRGCQRPWWAALALRCICWRHEGWSEEQKCALSPKLRGCPGAQATLDGLGRLQKPKLYGCNSLVPIHLHVECLKLGRFSPETASLLQKG